MGLDQYAHEIESGEDHNLDARLGEEKKPTQLAYWRKHNRLQGWMEALYKKRGGTEVFNCVDLELTLADIDELEEGIKTRNLPKTEGFFFGQDSYNYYEDGQPGWDMPGHGLGKLDPFVAGDIEFVEKARKSLRKGKRVVYSSWW